MINKNFFFTEPKIQDYREISLDAVLKEYLLYKGTWDSKGNPTNEAVSAKDLIGSGLFVYGLKSNPTNRRAVEYYCCREAQRRLLLSDRGNVITVPKELWNECNEYNEKYCRKSENE